MLSTAVIGTVTSSDFSSSLRLRLSHTMGSYTLATPTPTCSHSKTGALEMTMRSPQFLHPPCEHSVTRTPRKEKHHTPKDFTLVFSTVFTSQIQVRPSHIIKCDDAAVFTLCYGLITCSPHLFGIFYIPLQH